MSGLTTSSRHPGGVLVLEVDNPPVNALSPGVPEAISSTVRDAERDPTVTSIVIRGAGRMFIAGADINVLREAAEGNLDAAPDWHALFEQIENCRVPIVMAIHGAALGGGLELAMAGHYRLATANTIVGQPEVSLGIIPGAEGTQRLPRLAGVALALDMCITGRSLTAAEALDAGILDEMAGDDLTASAVAFAARVAGRPTHPRTRDQDARLGEVSTAAPLFSAARERASALRPFQTAPFKAIDAIAAAVALPFDAGCRRERELFLECLASEQARAMIHAFFAERTARKVPADARAAVASRLESSLASAKARLIDRGVPPAQIERALINFGMSPAAAAVPAPGHYVVPSRVSDAEIVDHVVGALAAEGAAMIETGLVGQPSAIDAISVQQIGFPAWRGGPLFAADRGRERP